MLAGTTEFKKPIHDPVEDGSAAAAASTEVFAPGLTTSPTTMPMSTEKNAVMANQIRVCAARRAALVTWRRLATDVTTAVNTSGGISSFSSWTYVDPTQSRVAANGSTSTAMKPRTRPMIRP